MRTAVVTGASQGLGRYIANTFLRDGWHVVGTGRSPRPADLEDAIVYSRFDASDAAACAAFWDDLTGTSNEGMCLVNNAGSYVASDGGLHEAKPEDFARQMQSVYFTSVYMTQGLVKAVSKAQIFNIISSSALLHEPSELAYGSAKDAQRHFFQALQEAYKPEQYKITNLYPDYVATHSPNPDAMSADDLAAFIVELAGSKASYYIRDVTIYPLKRDAQ
ncbi:MAG TPA: SDR family oxidoreductase [Verrucomicrobiae bacterium]|nr:SDR family oxidoreductase [Verrucomicrobiae bacterium]